MNVLNTMSKEEFMKLPYGFVKKYGSYLHFMNRIQKEARVRENKSFQGFYDQIKDADRLLTNDEKEQ